MNLILVDTSVWINYLRHRDRHLVDLLEQGIVACHPFIVGEIACGDLKNRKEIIELLEALPTVEVLEHSEVMMFLNSHMLMVKGIGYVDVHLLGSSLLTSTPLWTFDKSLAKAAEILKLMYNTDLSIDNHKD